MDPVEGSPEVALLAEDRAVDNQEVDYLVGDPEEVNQEEDQEVDNLEEDPVEGSPEADLLTEDQVEDLPATTSPVAQESAGIAVIKIIILAYKTAFCPPYA